MEHFLKIVIKLIGNTIFFFVSFFKSYTRCWEDQFLMSKWYTFRIKYLSWMSDLSLLATLDLTNINYHWLFRAGLFIAVIAFHWLCLLHFQRTTMLRCTFSYVYGSRCCHEYYSMNPYSRDIPKNLPMKLATSLYVWK